MTPVTSNALVCC